AEAELGQQRRVLQGGLVGLVEGRHQYHHPRAHQGVELPVEEARPQDGTQRPGAEGQAAVVLLVVELGLRVGGRGLVQQIQVVANCVIHHAAAPPKKRIEPQRHREEQDRGKRETRRKKISALVLFLPSCFLLCVVLLCVSVSLWFNPLFSHCRRLRGGD